jgi:hypothetical protein
MVARQERAIRLRQEYLTLLEQLEHPPLLIPPPLPEEPPMPPPPLTPAEIEELRMLPMPDPLTEIEERLGLSTSTRLPLTSVD